MRNHIEIFAICMTYYSSIFNMSERIIIIRKPIFKWYLETQWSPKVKKSEKIHFNKIAKIMVDRQFLESLGDHLFNCHYHSNFQFGSAFHLFLKRKTKVSFLKMKTSNVCSSLKIFFTHNCPFSIIEFPNTVLWTLLSEWLAKDALFSPKMKNYLRDAKHNEYEIEKTMIWF